MTKQEKIERLSEAEDILIALYSDMTFNNENKAQCKRLDTILSKTRILIELVAEATS